MKFDFKHWQYYFVTVSLTSLVSSQFILCTLTSSVISHKTAHRSDISKAMALCYLFCIALVRIDDLNGPLVSVILEAGSMYQRNTQQ